MLREALASGRHGLRLTLPPKLEVGQDDPALLNLVDREERIVWMLFYFQGVHFDFGGEQDRSELSAALGHYARHMFEDSFRQGKPPEGARPRTADPQWTPMVEVEHLDLDGARALRTIHRMSYQPGLEIVMGHLLIPLVDGLFEARVMSPGKQPLTGYRESAIMKGLGFEPGRPLPPQSVYDDPRHDAAFPGHPLSQIRAAQRWLRHDASLKVSRPAPVRVSREVPLPRLGCVVTPPPRFVQNTDGTGGATGSFTRVSFCGTDGIEAFVVVRRDRPRSPSALRAEIVEATRRLHLESEVRDVRITTEDLPSIRGRRQVQTIAEGSGHQGPLRNVLRWFVAEDGRLWFLMITGNAAVPADSRRAELDRALEMWRPL